VDRYLNSKQDRLDWELEAHCVEYEKYIKDNPARAFRRRYLASCAERFVRPLIRADAEERRGQAPLSRGSMSELGDADVEMWPHAKNFECIDWQPLQTKPASATTRAPSARRCRSIRSCRVLPDAFAALARHSKKCNEKAQSGEPMHWARHKSTDHLNCAARHLLTPMRSSDSGEIELVDAMWRCAACSPVARGEASRAAGIRPLSGVIGG